MIGFIHQLWQIPNQFRKAFLTPAKDPRVVYGPAHQSREAYSEKEEPGLDKVRTKLEKGFASLTSEIGLTVLQDLVEEFEQLQPLLVRRKNSDPLAIARSSPGARDLPSGDEHPGRCPGPGQDDGLIWSREAPVRGNKA